MWRRPVGDGVSTFLPYCFFLMGSKGLQDRGGQPALPRQWGWAGAAWKLYQGCDTCHKAGGYGLYECWASQRSWGTPRTSKMEVGHDLTAPYPQSKRVILHRLSRRSPPEAWSRIWNQHSTRGVHDTLCLGFCISVPQIASRHHRPESEATLSRPCREHAPLFYHVGRAKGPRLSPYQPRVGRVCLSA